MHVLLVRFSSLGDVVLTTSLVTALKRRWGHQLELSYMTSPALAPLLQGHPALKRVITVPRMKGLAGLRLAVGALSQLQREHPVDLWLDLHGTLRSLAMRWVGPVIPRLSVDKRTLERWLLTGFKWDLLSCQDPGVEGATPPPPHPRGRFGERLLQRLIRDFSGPFDLPLADQYAGGGGQLSSLTALAREGGGELLARYGIQGPFVLLAPSASFVEKRWAIDKFKALGERILGHHPELSLVVTAGPEDHFCSTLDGLGERFPGRYHNLQGATSLLETAQLCAEAHSFVGNDTGVPHMAEALGIAGVFILGPTGEEFGFYPHLPGSRVAMQRLWCRPCTTNGKGHCVRRERYCLTRISVDEVYQQWRGVDAVRS